MASGSRTLKLSILADIDNLKKNLNTGTKEVDTFGDKLTGFGKKAGLAFAAATAAAALYAGKLIKEGVESAIADEKAQASLAKTLENVTGATKAQIASVEQYILKTSLATGVTDDELRPSLDRLTRSTKDVEEAQRLQTLALDIAAGSGKSLGSVSEALAKAYDGNYGALKRLGVPLDESIIKSKDFDAATKALASTFKDQASVQADTFEGRMKRLKTALDEAKESVGAALLPALTRLVGFITDRVLPQINAFVAGLTGNEGVEQGLEGTAKASYDLGAAFRSMAISVGKVFAVFNADQNTGTSSGLAKVIGWAENVIKVFDKLIQGLAYTLGLIKVVSNPKNWLLGAEETVALANEYAGIATKGMPKAGIRTVNRSSTPMNINFPVAETSSLGAGSTVKAATNVSKAVKAATSSGVSNVSGMPSAMMPSGGYDSQLTKTEQNIYNFTVQGALDSESTARQIVQLLNDSQARGTLGASGLIGAVSF
jgi:hypothetical protein